MSTTKKEDDSDYLSQIIADMQKTVPAEKIMENGQLKTDVPSYLKLLTKFLRVLKNNDLPVILKREKDDNAIFCHDFLETKIKATSFQYANQEFLEIYNFVPYLSKLSRLKTKVYFDNYLIEAHISRNEWWLYKKKKGRIVTEKIVEIPKFSDFFPSKKVIRAKDLPVKYCQHLNSLSQRNIQKEIINISEKAFRALLESWKSEEKIASLSLYFAVDKNDKVLISDFDICLIKIEKERKEEIRISRKEAVSKMQLSVNNVLILNIANIQTTENERIKKGKK